MIVCLCSRISDRDVRNAAAAGAASADDVFSHCGASPCCGSCLQAIDDLLAAPAMAAAGGPASSWG
jgi:bacterioferritin-associated ferredoxin